MFFLLLMLILFGLLMMSAARRAARRRRDHEEEYARQSDPGDGEGPEVRVGSPLDLLFGGSGWSSYEYDPQTGDWVEVSDREPEPPAPRQEEQETAERPKRRQRRWQG